MLSEQIIEDVFSLQKKYYLEQRTYPNPELVARISVGYFFKELANAIEQVAMGNSPTKFDIYAVCG